MKGGDICLYGAIRGMSWFCGIDVMSRKGEIGLIAAGLPTLLINVNSDTCSKLTELTMCPFHKQLSTEGFFERVCVCDEQQQWRPYGFRYLQTKDKFLW